MHVLRYAVTWNQLVYTIPGLIACATLGGIAPNQVIARSEFEVHREMFTEWM